MKKNDQQQLKQRIKEYTQNILTEDEDWDYCFILKVLTYKLKRTRECIVKNNFIEDTDIISKQISEVERLLDNVIKDNYDEKYYDELEKKYGKLIHKTIPVKCKKTGKNNFYEIKIYREHETTKNHDQIHKESLNNFKKARQEKSNDLKKAFDIMHKHLFEWWD